MDSTDDIQNEYETDRDTRHQPRVYPIRFYRAAKEGNWTIVCNHSSRKGLLRFYADHAGQGLFNQVLLNTGEVCDC